MTGHRTLLEFALVLLLGLAATIGATAVEPSASACARGEACEGDAGEACEGDDTGLLMTAKEVHQHAARSTTEGIDEIVDEEAPEEGCDVCSSSYQGSTIEIVNNCGKSVDVFTDAGLYGKCVWDGVKVPPCLKSLAAGGRATVGLYGSQRDAKPWGYAFHVEPSVSTRFEITPGNENIEDSWDISYNAGYDIGMTVKTPPGNAKALDVAIDHEAPDAYKRGTDGCQVQPCSSPTYSSKQGRYELYLCNRPGDVNTPGPCGCSACPGIPCEPHTPGCTTSGSGIWCYTGGPSCPTCASGKAECPKECPRSGYSMLR